MVPRRYLWQSAWLWNVSLDNFWPQAPQLCERTTSNPYSTKGPHCWPWNCRCSNSDGCQTKIEMDTARASPGFMPEPQGLVRAFSLQRLEKEQQRTEEGHTALTTSATFSAQNCKFTDCSSQNDSLSPWFVILIAQQSHLVFCNTFYREFTDISWA